ncbi:MAG: SDR family NAD(P)-dependent oxidoreductase [Bacteroidales bacterium]|nr:SDR family NAD(P)-dependent oxidoreductase [Bacteroidales bacterium]
MQKTILITGSTDGIGKETAFHLAGRGYRVLIHGRDSEKVERTISEVKKKSGNNNISGYVADLSSLLKVKEMTVALLDTEKKLDVLLNNAGVIMKSYQLSDEGLEMTFSVNHLSHFYLSGLLLPLLLKNEKSKIINLSSMVHSSNIDFDELLDPRFFDSVNAYSLSKLCNVLFTYKLSGILKDTGITVNCMHPGVINTKMLKDTWGPIGSPVKEGADREVFLVESELTDMLTGKYFQDNRERKSSIVSYDKTIQTALWNLSISLLEKAGMSAGYPIE